jgi:hypothetical protein
MNVVNVYKTKLKYLLPAKNTPFRGYLKKDSRAIFVVAMIKYRQKSI